MSRRQNAQRREPDRTPPVRPYRQILLLIGLAAMAVIVIALSSPETVESIQAWRQTTIEFLTTDEHR